jgi:hypothetical protein
MDYTRFETADFPKDAGAASAAQQGRTVAQPVIFRLRWRLF